MIDKLIKENYLKLSITQKKLADDLLANIREVSYLTSKEFAVRNEVSEPVVFRFCNKLGLDGYSELKTEIINSLAEQTEVAFENSQNVYLDKICEGVIKNIEKIRVDFSDERITRMARKLSEFENIYIMGYGQAYGTASEIFSTMAEMRFNVNFLRDALTDVPGYLKFGEKNLYIAVSFAPHRTYTYRYSHLAKKMGAELITITDNPLNELAIIADENYVVEKIDIEGETVFLTEGISILMKTLYRKYKELFEDSISEVQQELNAIIEVLESTS